MNLAPEMISRDPQMRRLFEMAKNVAHARASILILGESGTGKEVLAKFIHAQSARNSKKMIAVNCAAVPEGLLESELFGHERGAFTGAVAAKPGKFELANGSTLLLDEMGEMPLPLQAKILRVLQEGEFERVGGVHSIRVNVRIIATTHRNLRELVKAGSFREDLYYRLKVIEFRVPALRERPADIEFLAQSFVARLCQANALAPKTLAPDALVSLRQWKWPGNVRELENTIERAVLLSPTEVISAHDLQLLTDEREMSSGLAPDHLRPGMTISEAEQQLILKTLEFTQSNRTEAARLLGISIRTLRNKIQEYKEEGVHL